MTLEVISELPSAESSQPPLLFIHGAWHGAWCWRNFLTFFAEHGYAAHALSLQAHAGSPGRPSLRRASIGGYVEDVAEVVSQLPAPPVLIAHSMGGFVTHHYLLKHSAAGAVFLAAVPPRGAWHATWHALRRHPIAFVHVNAVMRLYPLMATVDLAKDMLFSPATPKDLVGQYHPLLQDESYLAYLGMLFKPVLRRTTTSPVLVLGASDDAIIDESDVRSTGRFYGLAPVMIQGIGHDMMLDTRWKEVAEAILHWLRR